MAVSTALRTVASAMADFTTVEASHFSSVVLVILAGRRRTIRIVLVKVIALLGIIRATVVNFISCKLSETWSVF